MCDGEGCWSFIIHIGVCVQPLAVPANKCASSGVMSKTGQRVRQDRQGRQSQTEQKVRQGRQSQTGQAESDRGDRVRQGREFSTPRLSI